MRRCLVLTIVILAAAAPAARGDGVPITNGDVGAGGITARGVATRYLALRVPGGTLVMGIERRSGKILVSRFFSRPVTVTAVAYDGSGTGLSADGRTLVLVTPRTTFPAPRSRFTVLDTSTLRVRARVALKGDLALDAISPDGRRLYLIQTLRDTTRYIVRAYDVAQRRLLPDPVVDPAEPDEPIRGFPVARALSRDGRWAYTLYGGGSDTPFVHALDTGGGRARCIDLDALAGPRELFDLRLAVARGGVITVRDRSARPLLRIEPRTFAVRPPRRPIERSAGWVAPAAGAGLLVLLAGGAVTAGQPRRAS
jgi:hypothetical protein